MSLPNALTLSRLVAIPPLMILLAMRFDGHDQVAALVFVAFAFTDLLDGYLARRQDKVSDVGKFLDPLADKLFVIAVLVALVQEGQVAAWVVVVIASRELLITVLRSVGASRQRIISAAASGKAKTWTQIVAVTLLILQRPYPWLGVPAALALAVAVLLTVWSGFDYLWRYRRLMYVEETSGREPQPEPLADELGDLLAAKHLTIAVAESCTGGLLGSLITQRSGSSSYFLGGVIAYANSVKSDELGVGADLLRSHGAVSREVAAAMAEGVRSRFRSSLGAAITGIAGPRSDDTDKPVGLTYVAVTAGSGTSVSEHNFKGDREAIRRQAAREALRMTIEAAGKPAEVRA